MVSFHFVFLCKTEHNWVKNFDCVSSFKDHSGQAIAVKSQKQVYFVKTRHLFCIFCLN